MIAWNEPGAAFEDVCFLRNQESYTFELGASRRVTQKTFEFAKECVMNALTGGNIFPLDGKMYSQSQLQSLYVHEWGILMWNVEVGDYLKKDTIIAHLYTHEEIIPVFSWFSGIVLIKNPIQAPYSGQEIGQMLMTE